MIWALLLACTHSPPASWGEPVPMADPPVVLEVPSTPEDCPPLALIPGEPMTLDCRGQVLSDAEAVEGIWAAESATYWETQYRLCVRYREVDRIAAGQVYQDLQRARRRDWLSVLGVVAGLALGVAYAAALGGAL